MSEAKKANVAIYTRVSTLYQIDKDSLPMQRKDLIAYANVILNTDSYTIFEDAGYSGKNTDRPQFQNMMSRIRQGEFTHILVWKIDRISRNLLDFATMYEELKELGVIFVSKNEQFDTSSAMGEAMLKIILVFAELERNMTSERVSATMISRANNGLWNGGHVPFGYNYNSETKEFTINETEAEVLRFIHNHYEQNRSLIYLARTLNDKGISTRAGNAWNPTSLRLILISVFNCGNYRYNVLKEGNRQKVKDESEWITVQDHHPAIIDKEQKQRILTILKNNAKNKSYHRPNSKTHIFQDKIICGCCSETMVSSTSKKLEFEYTRYLCPTRRKSKMMCNAVAVSDLNVGEFVFNYILNILNAKSNKDNIQNLQDLQKMLLHGDTFHNIKAIEPDGLSELLEVFAYSSENVFGKNLKLKSSIKDIPKLKAERNRTERALNRLQDLYLYADDSMSNAEYVLKRNDLINKIDRIDEQIEELQSNDIETSISDDVFIRKASEFILTQKLTNRSYVNYRSLAKTVDADVIRIFIDEIIDSITVSEGRVKSIIFKNGICNQFIFS